MQKLNLYVENLTMTDSYYMRRTKLVDAAARRDLCLNLQNVSSETYGELRLIASEEVAPQVA